MEAALRGANRSPQKLVTREDAGRYFEKLPPERIQEERPDFQCVATDTQTNRRFL